MHQEFSSNISDDQVTSTSYYQPYTTQSWAGLVILLAIFMAIILGFVLFWCVSHASSKPPGYRFLLPIEDLWDERYLPVPVHSGHMDTPVKYAYSDNENPIIPSDNRSTDIAQSFRNFINEGYFIPQNKPTLLSSEPRETCYSNSEALPLSVIVTDEIYRMDPIIYKSSNCIRSLHFH